MTQRRTYLGPLTDNTRWDAIPLRPGDVLVVTPPKCGTTWMQTIVALLFSGDPEAETQLTTRMPWVDIRLRELADVAGRLEAMTDRRSMKSHTPMDGLPLDDAVQYLCVFRHPLDAHLSFRRHVRNMPISLLDAWYPDVDAHGETFRRFLEGGAEGPDCDANTLAHMVRHYQAAQGLADRSNVTLFHYADMLRDLEGVFDQVARLLGISHPADVMAHLVHAARFDNMKENATRFAPGGGTGFYKSDSDFFFAGTNGQWKGVLSDAEYAAYDAKMAALLPPEDRAWLERGAAGM